MVRQLFVFLVFGLLVFTPQAKASLLLEPYLGYALNGKGINSGSTDISYDTVTYGARVGYSSIIGLMFGIDYSLQSPEIDFEQPNGTIDSDKRDKSQLGVFVGYELPLLFRGWATYYVASKLEHSDGDKETGNGYAVGVGFTGLPFLSLNLEYRSCEYDEIERASNGDKEAIDRGLKEILLSVSLPLSF